ncbi:MAG: hypothetical protein WBB45_06095 [Cyclobacteriaceae bacterium]
MLRHDYYKESITDQFKLVPVPSTQKLMEKAEFLVRNDKAGINILADLDRPEKLLSHLEGEEPVKLYFWLFTTNPYFVNITDIPVEAPNKVLFLTNKGKEHNPDKPVSLHEEEYASSMDQYPVSADPVGTFGFEKGQDFDVKTSGADSISLNGVAGTDVSLALSTSAAMEGRYVIYGDGEEKSFIYPGASLSLRPLGLIELIIDGDLKEQIVDGIKTDEQSPSFTFEVKFHRRATHWKYLIVPKYSNGIKQTIIHSEDNDASFSGPEEVKLSNGATAWAFDSSKALDLKELPNYHFQLKRSGANGSGKVIIARLPTPQIDMIKPESRAVGSKVYSEIIVFI